MANINTDQFGINKSGGGGGSAASENLRKLTAYNGVIDNVANIVTINADPTKIDVKSFKYRTVDKTDPNAVVETIVTFAGQTAIAGTFPTNGETQYVYINFSTGLIEISNVAQGGQDILTKGILGNLDADATDAFFDAVVDTPQTGYGLESVAEALLRRLGGVNLKGAALSGNAILTIDKTAGEAIGMGRGYDADFNDPHMEATGAEAPMGTNAGFLLRIYEDAGGEVQFSASGTFEVDPANYNNAGVLSSVTSSQWTIQRIFFFYGDDIPTVYYGNATYNSLSNAEMAINTESFTENAGTFEAVFLGFLLIKGNATVTNDLAFAKFVAPTRIRL